MSINTDYTWRIAAAMVRARRPESSWSAARDERNAGRLAVLGLQSASRLSTMTSKVSSLQQIIQASNAIPAISIGLQADAMLSATVCLAVVSGQQIDQ